MHIINFIRTSWHVPRGPMNRRWARYIGPYGCLGYIVNQYDSSSVELSFSTFMKRDGIPINLNVTDG